MSATQSLALFNRLLSGLLYFLKRKEVQHAQDDPATYLADGDQLHKSDKSFADLSKQSKPDKTE